MTRSYIGGMRDSESIQFALWLHHTRGYSDSSAANLAYRVRFAQKRGILTPEQVDEKIRNHSPHLRTITRSALRNWQEYLEEVTTKDISVATLTS